MEAIFSPTVQMKELDSSEAKKFTQEQLGSQWQSWDSPWSSYSSKSEFLNILKHCLVESGTREALEGSLITQMLWQLF